MEQLKPNLTEICDEISFYFQFSADMGIIQMKTQLILNKKHMWIHIHNKTLKKRK